MKPIGGKVAIDRAVADTVTKGGILLPDIAVGKPLKGVIVAVGPGRLNQDGSRTPMQVKVGDKVIWAPYGGTEIEAGRVPARFVIMDEEQLLAVETDDEKAAK